MKDAPYSIEISEDEQPFAIKEHFIKYLRYWPWFLMGVFISLALGFVYLRYAPIIYKSEAKIRLLDDSKDLGFSIDPMSILNGSTKINMDNEIEVLKSYRILSKVVDKLNLDVNYFVVGNLKKTQIWNPPFVVTKIISTDSLAKPLSYTINLNLDGLKITDDKDSLITTNLFGISSVPHFPIQIEMLDGILAEEYNGITYSVVILPKKDVVMQLVKDIEAETTNKTSEIVILSLKGENPDQCESILNAVIDEFNHDGILDRQLVSRRTVDFIDERFLSLSGELDSIEGNKKNFKRSNSLTYIEADAGLTMQKKSVAEDEANVLENQISLSNLLGETLSSESDYGLLPADIGLESSSINALVADFNKTVLEREKLASSAGENNPTLQELSSQLQRGKQNIIQTVKMYQKQLRVSMNQLNDQKSRAGAMFYGLPEKEQKLRSIERQQSIKENLYLLLLQKREEAAINFAVTAPSIKVVDYGLSSNKPIEPKKKLVLGVSLLLGLLLPYGFLFVKFSLDTKIHERADLEKAAPEIEVLGEIPSIEGDKKYIEPNDTSNISEAFRILATNVSFHLPPKVQGEGQVIYVTSSIKKEGKTLTALNLSLAFAGIKKRVLLVGADLRNPQLHQYYETIGNGIGFSSYLSNNKIKWKDCIQDGFTKNEFHKVCFAGKIPSNAPILLLDERFGKFISEAKKEFDIIIVDTAPTVLVTDTLLISQFADLTLFVLRANYTDKRILEHSKNLNKTGRLQNMAYVLNDGKLGTTYGYGFGYGADTGQEPRNKWLNRMLKRK
jgi:capsular exopolysaccharide synthesis family protein